MRSGFEAAVGGSAPLTRSLASAAEDGTTLQDDVDRRSDGDGEEAVDGASWAWVLMHSRADTTSTELLPCLQSAVAAIQSMDDASQQQPSQGEDDGRTDGSRAVWLSFDVASLIVDAAATIAPPPTPMMQVAKQQPRTTKMAVRSSALSRRA